MEQAESQNNELDIGSGEILALRYHGEEDRVAKIARAITTASENHFGCPVDEAIDKWMGASTDEKHAVEVLAGQLLIKDQQASQDAITMLLYNMWLSVAGDKIEFLGFIDQIFPEDAHLRKSLISPEGFGGVLFYQIIDAFRAHYEEVITTEQLFYLINYSVDWVKNKRSFKGGVVLSTIGRVMKNPEIPQEQAVETVGAIIDVIDSANPRLNRGEFMVEIQQITKELDIPRSVIGPKADSVVAKRRLSNVNTRVVVDMAGKETKANKVMIYTFEIPVSAYGDEVNVRGSSLVTNAYNLILEMTTNSEERKKRGLT